MIPHFVILLDGGLVHRRTASLASPTRTQPGANPTWSFWWRVRNCVFCVFGCWCWFVFVSVCNPHFCVRVCHFLSWLDQNGTKTSRLLSLATISTGRTFHKTRKLRSVPLVCFWFKLLFSVKPILFQPVTVNPFTLNLVIILDRKRKRLTNSG